MGTTEAGSKISDHVEAALVECVPEPEPLAVDVSAQPLDAPTPTIAAQDATIEQTGAGPPPKEGW